MFLIAKIPVYICSIRLQKLLSVHVLNLLLINICACAQKFEYSMDYRVTKLMLETQNNTFSIYTNVSRNTLVQ